MEEFDLVVTQRAHIVNMKVRFRWTSAGFRVYLCRCNSNAFRQFLRMLTVKNTKDTSMLAALDVTPD